MYKSISINLSEQSIAILMERYPFMDSIESIANMLVNAEVGIHLKHKNVMEELRATYVEVKDHE